MENELQAVKRDIEAARADLARAREKNDDNQATAAMMYLASLIDKEKRIEACLAPPPSAANFKKTIRVHVKLGKEIRPFRITVSQDSPIWEAVKNQVQFTSNIPRNCNLDVFQLKDSRGYFVNEFSLLDENEEYVFEIPTFITPASASDWTPSYTSQLQIYFEDETKITGFLGSEHNLSAIARECLDNLAGLAENNHALYNTDDKNFDAKQKEIRQSRELQDVIRKSLFLMEHYPNNEAIVDNFLVHLFIRMGFYSGMLYAVPQLNLQLKFGDDDIKTAKPDFVIMDILTFLRMAVFEEKNVKESQDKNAEAQLIAEVIAAHQINTEKFERPLKARRTEITDSAAATTEDFCAPQTIFAVRVAGYHFTFYEVKVTESIIMAMQTKMSAMSTTIIKRYGGDRGLNFHNSGDREMIITILDCWRDKICEEGQASIRRNSR